LIGAHNPVENYGLFRIESAAVLKSEEDERVNTYPGLRSELN